MEMDDADVHSEEQPDYGESSESESEEEEEGETVKAVVVQDKGKGSVSNFTVLVFWCHYVLSFMVFLIIYCFSETK